MKGNKGGRPTKYKASFCKKADEYLKIHQDIETKVLKKVSSKGEIYDNKLEVKLPTLQGFALFIGVNESTLYEWEKKYPEFSKSLKKIKSEQHDRLVHKGLSGDYNPMIAKLILSSNHGYRERVDGTTNGKDLPAPIMPINRNAISSDNSD